MYLFKQLEVVISGPANMASPLSPIARLRASYEKALLLPTAIPGTDYAVGQDTIDRAFLPATPMLKHFTTGERELALEAYLHNNEDRQIPENRIEAAAVDRPNAVFSLVMTSFFLISFLSSQRSRRNPFSTGGSSVTPTSDGLRVSRIWASLVP